MTLIREFVRIEQTIRGQTTDYYLSDEFKSFQIPRDRWHSWDQQQRSRHLSLFYNVSKETLIRSTDGTKTSEPSKTKGKKIGQRKRKVAAKMFTPKKFKYSQN